MPTPLPTEAASQRVAEQRLITAQLAPALAGLGAPSNSGVYADAAGALITGYSDLSALMASDWYSERRDEAGVTGLFTPALAPAPEPAQLDSSLSWALKPLETDDVDLAGRQVVAAAQKITADAARETIAGASQDDGSALGWVRFAESSACYFCALLATRTIGSTRGENGAVYHTRESAMFKGKHRPRIANGGVRRRGQTYAYEQTYSDDKYHDHCHCTAVPVFAGQDYEPPDYVVEWDELYRRHGYENGKASINAFRRAYENPPGAA